MLSWSTSSIQYIQMPNTSSNTEDLEVNLRLYPWYQAATGFMPWLPIFFLFFFQHVSLSHAIQLGAVYYFSVFLLEVPSGYFSDRLGRRLTLQLSAGFAFLAYLIFIQSSNFVGLAVGQFMLAAFFSLKSGSDNSLLFDTLTALDRTSEYATREANATRYSMLSFAVAALLGGLTGMFNLTIPYYLSVIGAAAALAVCFKFTEPPADKAAEPFLRQLGICFKQLKQPQLLWLFGFFVFSYSLLHVPAEFNQPYLKLLQIKILASNDSSALISGIMVAISMVGGALGASTSMALMKRFGVRKLLLCGLGFMVIIIIGMASILHSAVLLLVLFRNFPIAMCEAPMLSAIAPHIQSHYRATYLSVQSLAGRLGFSIMLYSLSSVVASTEESEKLLWPELQSALLISLVIGLMCFGLLAIFRAKLDN